MMGNLGTRWVAIAVVAATIGGGAIGATAFGGATAGSAAAVNPPTTGSGLAVGTPIATLTGATGSGSSGSGNSGSGNSGSGTTGSGSTLNGVPTISVSGTGTANGTPDTLTIDIGATTNAATAAGALDKNDSEMSTLDQVFTNAGAQPSDLQTSDLELNPNYDGSGAVTGYQVSDTLTVTLNGIANAGTIIDAAAGAVGNDVRLNGVSFSISNTSALMKTARTAAISAAASEAADLAGAAGDKLGPAVSITDSEDNTPVSPMPMYARSTASATAAVPLQAGSQAVTVNVDVVYELLPATS
jgi:uncharacterized protein